MAADRRSAFAGPGWHAAAVIAGARVAQVLGMLLTARIGTSLLPPDQMAGVVQVTSIASAFNLVLIVPVWHYMARAFNDWRLRGELAGNASRFLRYVALIAVSATTVGGLLDGALHMVTGVGALTTATLVGVYIVGSAISTLGTSGLNLLGRRIHFALYSNVPVWVGLALSIVLYEARPDPSSWALGQFIGFVIGAVSYLSLRREIRRAAPEENAVSEPRPFTVRTVAFFAWPTVVTAGLWWVQSQSYRFVLDARSGAAAVGLFAIGYGLAASPIALYESIFGQIYEPVYYRALTGTSAERQAAAWHDYAAAYLPGLTVVVLFIAAAGPFMARILVGDEFREAAGTLVAWGALVEGLRAAGAMVYNAGVAKVDTRLTILPVAGGALIAPVAVGLLAPVDPLHGTALGLLMAGIVSLVLGVRNTMTALPIRWPVGQIARGALFALPLVVALLIVRGFVAKPSLLVSLVVLAPAGLGLMAVQSYLLKPAFNRQVDQNVIA